MLPPEFHAQVHSSARYPKRLLHHPQTQTPDGHHLWDEVRGTAAMGTGWYYRYVLRVPLPGVRLVMLFRYCGNRIVREVVSWVAKFWMMVVSRPLD